MKHVIIGAGVVGTATGVWLIANCEYVIFYDINIEALKKLKFVRYDLGVTNNVSLTRLTGLEKLKSVRDLAIFGNHSLASLEGIKNLTYIDEDLWVTDNASLTSIEAFNKLKSVGKDMHISYNDSLTSLAGFDKLNYVGGDLEIIDNHEPTVITINCVMASLQSQEAVKILHHLHSPSTENRLGNIQLNYLIYNGLTGKFYEIVGTSPISLPQSSSGRLEVIMVERSSCRRMMISNRYSPLRLGNCFMPMSSRISKSTLRYLAITLS